MKAIRLQESTSNANNSLKHDIISESNIAVWCFVSSTNNNTRIQ